MDNGPEHAAPPGTVQSSRLAHWIERYAEWAPRHPWLLILISFLLTAACSVGFMDLRFDADTRTFFGKDNPQYLALTDLEQRFGRANSLVFIVTAKDGNLFRKDNLTAVEELNDRAWYVPYSTRVDSIVSYQSTRAEGDEIVVEPLFEDAATMDQADLDKVRERALATEDLTSWLLASDGRVTGVFVTVRNPGKSKDEIGEVVQFAHQVQADFQAKYPDIEIRLSGGVMADATFGEAGFRDLTNLAPIMIGLIVLTLVLGYRSVAATYITCCVVFLSVICALGMAGAFGITINSATGGAPVVIMTLCVADCVHLMAYAKQEMARGLTRQQALAESLRFNMVAIFMTSATDVIGFMALNFGDSPPLQELGNIVSVGVIAGFIFSVTLAPAMITLMPSALSLREMRGQRLVKRLSGYLVEKRNRLVLILMVAMVILGAGTTQIVYDDDFINYFSEDYAFRRDTDYLQNHLTGLQVLQFALPSGETEGVTDPEYLKEVDAFAEWLRSHPNVAHVHAVSDVVKRLNKNLHGDDPAFEVIPDSRELIAQLLLFYELSVPFGQDLTTQIDLTKSATKLTAQLVHVSSAQIRAIAADAEAWMKEHTPKIAATATGLSMAYAYLSKTNVEAMIDGTFVALLLIAFTMFFVVRDWKLSLLSLLPNLFPAVAALGLWGWVHGEVNLAVSVIASISFGIIVDDTTHFFAKYAYDRKNGMAPQAAMKSAIEDVGLAVLVTSVVLVAGFLVLATSGFQISVHMGLLTAITIVISVFAEFMMVPALLLWFDRKR